MGDSSANFGRGWKLACSLAAVAGVACFAPAAAESRARDRDRDGLSDRYELRKSHTGIRRADTDRDGLRDGYEVRKSKTNPRRADTDRDGLSDRFELRRSHTHPRKRDTDRDGMNDGLELMLGRDPRKPDLQQTPFDPPPAVPAGGAPVDADPFPAPPAPQQDLLPPDTSITAGPSGLVNSGSTSISFASSEPGSTFECRLDAGAWSDCASPTSYSALDAGAHTFDVRATDAAGNTDASPASRSWTINASTPDDATPPDTSIASGPSGTVTTRSASFAFSSTESGSAFECRLDGAAWGSCTSPKSYTAIPDGTHTFHVRATDTAGNTDASVASRTWTVDATAPNTSISSGPTGSVSSSSASFAFSAGDAGSTFECRLDGGAWVACASPQSYSSLATGSHTFHVRASDVAGNRDGSPATRTWVVAAADSAPSPGKNCMADPSVCGFPDVENTGVQPGVALTPVRGQVTLATAGQVYENKLVTGGITVAAPNVTIRNVKLVATDDYYGIRAFGWQNNVSGLLVEHVEIDLNNKTTLKGIAFDGYTARNVFFHNGSDCAHMGGNVTIENSLCVSGPDADDDGWPDGSAFCNGPDHFDGFQSDGGHNITIRHNTIRNPCGQTSNILMSSNTDGISNVRIEDNLLAGGGYSLYCNAGPDVPNETVTGNRFSKRYYATGGHWGPTAHCEDADVFSGNVWDETGASL